MTYIIAEIGQNHNGSFANAMDLIDAAERTGCNAVKFTKRDLQFEFTNLVADKKYDSPHSYGKTYREHREHLEFTDSEMCQLIDYSKDKGIDFVLTLCNKRLVERYFKKTVAVFKIASRDITNIPLLEEVARKSKVPIILSTGLSSCLVEINVAVKKIIQNSKQYNTVFVMHCISEYPLIDRNVRLNRIIWLRDNVKPGLKIGYSDHSLGIESCSAAVAMGAKIVEKHITMDKEGKGSDHASSITEPEFTQMVKNIRKTEILMGQEGDHVFNESDAILKNRKKLMRSICSAVHINKGTIIESKHLCMLSPGDGMAWGNRSSLLKKKAIKDIPSHTKLSGWMVR